MAQHFLLSAAARTISLCKVMRMTDTEVETTFAVIRWATTAGRPVCPGCGCEVCYDCRRPNGAARWRCKACRKDFSLTSGTLFAFHKLDLRDYLAAVVIVCDEVKAKSALALSRDLDVQYKTAFVLAHKIREAMGVEFRDRHLGGAGQHVEVDGAYFGGYVRPENRKEDRTDRRLAENQSDKRQVVVVVRERALAGTSLGGTIDTKRINHAVEYANDEACTNQAESYFARLRRGEIGHHHHIAGDYLIRYAREAAWKEDHRRDSNGLQVGTIVRLVSRSGPSVDFCGYWQRHRQVA
jgi:transposase-like protein